MDGGSNARPMENDGMEIVDINGKSCVGTWPSQFRAFRPLGQAKLNISIGGVFCIRLRTVEILLVLRDMLHVNFTTGLHKKCST
jgi:hypothetical protein